MLIIFDLGLFMSKSKEEIEEWKNFRKEILENKSKSDDDFEKYITFISSGALGLTLVFIEKIVPLKNAIVIWLLALGWFTLAFTLILNLYSHYLSSKYSAQSIDDIYNEIKYDKLEKNINKRNKRIEHLNRLSIVLLLIGILCILTFSTINIYI